MDETINLVLLLTFGLLHFLHLLTHSIRLIISIILRINDRFDQLLITLRLRTRNVRRDLRSIKKLPSHLAIIFIPINYQLNKYLDPKSHSKRIGSFLNSNLSDPPQLTSEKDQQLELYRFQQDQELQSILENVSRILLWSMEAGIKEITFYDERGLLKSHKFQLIQFLSNIPTFIKGNDHISWASIEPKLTDEVEILSKFEISYQPLAVNSKKSSSPKPRKRSESNSETNLVRQNTHRKTIKINLIDRHQGHQHLAKVTRALVEIIKLNDQTKFNFDDLNVKTIGEKICSTSIGLPDLLLVLGGRSLRFRGFPPWQLTLTEIYHARSYGILPYQIQYREYLEALRVFGNCEQRVGT